MQTQIMDYQKFKLKKSISNGLKKNLIAINEISVLRQSKQTASLNISVGQNEIIKKLYEIKPPFNVSRPALFAATQAVKDTNWLNKAIKHNNYWSEKILSLIHI